PAVSLDRSKFITAVTCTSASTRIAITFADHIAFHTAFDDWTKHRQGFILISYVAGCGSGDDSAEHSFHLVSSVVGVEKDLRIVCQMETVPIHHTVHPDQEVRLNVVTYSLRNHAPPHHASAR
ncbi:hypothetical protein C8R43DRAFT_850983, partial [Mycena crocata]